MNNVNTLNNASVNQKKSSGLGKLSQVLALCTILSVANPTEMRADNIMDGSMQNVEVVQNSNIINNIKIRTGVSLPSAYAQELQVFVQNSKILDDDGIKRFTEDFIVKQMQSNRGISRQNQLLFIWDAIYEQITGKNIYTGEDGNNCRLSEFENAMDIVEQCGKDYNIGFKAYVRKRTADARQQSADARQQSADARQQSADARQNRINTTYRGLQDMINFYNIYERNPNNVKSEDIKQAKEHSKRIIQNCKEFGIDYRAILLKEVGDDIKVGEILKFYSIE